jgi:hypothetical protein
MKKIARRGFLSILCLCFLLLPSNVLSDIDISVDPHGKEGMCHYCHTSKVVEKGKAGFRLNTVEATCLECHKKRGATLEYYLQQMLPDVKIKKKMIVYFKGHTDFSCHICHHEMCQSNSRKELQLRNSHIQLDKSGEIIEKACLFCHTTLPDYKHPSFENAVMRYDISYLCSLCHAMSSQKGGFGIGKRMTDAMVRKKKHFEKKFDVSLPLGPNNTVVCASCHNPHQAGVILGKGGYAGIPGKRRLVIDNVWQLCVVCHWGGRSLP